MTIDNYTDRERALRCAVADLQAENKDLQDKLAQQAAMVEKCMEAMNENADHGEKAEAKLAALEGQEPVMIYEGRCVIDCGDSGHRDVTMLKMIPEGAHLYAAAGARPGFDLITHLHRQIAFSQRTFGPGERTAGVLDHIRKELIEIEAAPTDLTEWVDLILLAFDGAWRAGHTAEAICQGIDAKQTKNEGRTWPDWRTAAPGKAIEHVRSAE